MGWQTGLEIASSVGKAGKPHGSLGSAKRGLNANAPRGTRSGRPMVKSQLGNLVRNVEGQGYPSGINIRGLDGRAWQTGRQAGVGEQMTE